ncbi:hypothetical protein HPP92_026717 [Vanilla planifolia]|uniref:Dof-type domain-containing protein n=1 Tax=Vanilla planifolia TaxID=51239 RepID=A0A835U6L3_VANPL|nr:hypothetical protein HPP92_026717 [Vanilla planifolia]
MTEGKDPTIKLFGRKIPLSEEQPPFEEAVIVDSALGEETPAEEGEKETCKAKLKTQVTTLGSSIKWDLDKKEQHTSCLRKAGEDDMKGSPEIAKTAEEPKPEHDHYGADTSGKERAIKKPDKVLPCPRCSSMDTKFCYYNNYNVNQPRHFCKNCQRYWTAGGTMRNVPVGAGRRKSKHYVSSYGHNMVASDAAESVQVDGPEQNQRGLRKHLDGNCAVLQFGQDVPLSESMASVLNLGKQKITSESSCSAQEENREEPSCSSSITASKLVEHDFPAETGHSYVTGLVHSHQLQCETGSPWIYPWNPGWNNVAAVAALTAVGFCSTESVTGQENGDHVPMLTVAPSFPIPFVPAPFWGCMPTWSVGQWAQKWAGSMKGSSSSSTSTSNCSGNGFPNLGKHSRKLLYSLRRRGEDIMGSQNAENRRSS